VRRSCRPPRGADLSPASASAPVRNHAAFIWSVADLLRGDYKRSEYRVEIAYSEQDEGYVARVPELGCPPGVGRLKNLEALRKLGRPISSTLSRRSGSATTRWRSSPSPSPTPRSHCAVVLGTIRPTPRPAARGSDDLTTPCSR
jgi:hypothetical protein